MSTKKTGTKNSGTEKTGPKHRATYARDKRTGGWLVRVTGPYPEKFAGREIPVETRTGEIHTEKLTTLIWSGSDQESNKPVALYQFEAKPREQAVDDDLPF